MSLEQNDPSSFDAVDAAAAIDAMVDLAEQCRRQAAALPAGFIGEAFRKLRAARVWLDAHMTPFEAPNLELLLNAPEGVIPIEALIDSLRWTAVELTQV